MKLNRECALMQRYGQLCSGLGVLRIKRSRHTRRPFAYAHSVLGSGLRRFGSGSQQQNWCATALSEMVIWSITTKHGRARRPVYW